MSTDDAANAAVGGAAALDARLGFVLELERLKAVLRRTKPIGLERYENSAEHSWQIAVLAMVFVDLADEPVDLGRVVRMLLVHDIPEIDAGDTFVYADQARADQGPVEEAAARRLFGLLPEPTASELLNLWLEFEANATPEARFARAMDRLMPVLQNLNNDAQSWREHGITREQVEAKNHVIGHASRALWDTVAERLEAAENAGLFTRPAPKA